MDRDPLPRSSLQVAGGGWTAVSPAMNVNRSRAVAGARGARGPLRRSLAALLDVPAPELLGVLVQEVVDVFAQLLVALGDLRIRFRRRRLVDLVAPAGLARLGLPTAVTRRHRAASSTRSHCHQGSVQQTYRAGTTIAPIRHCAG